MLQFESSWFSARKEYSFHLYGGAAMFEWPAKAPQWRFFTFEVLSPAGWSVSAPFTDWSHTRYNWSEWSLIPKHGYDMPSEYVSMPLWVPLVLLLLLKLFLWRCSRSPPPGHCLTCRYDLTGNVSGVCPECGTKIDAASAGGMAAAVGGHVEGGDTTDA